MLNPTHLLLALHDGARTAEQTGQSGVAAVLDTMKRSLAESIAHANDRHGFGQGWRQEDLKAIFEEAR
jgi:hypothetical protein